MSEELGFYLADALAIGGTLVMTLALSGLVRFPSHFVHLHAASMALVVGTVLVLAASVGTGDLDIMLRAALVGGFLLLTFPVGTYALAGRELKEQRSDDVPEAHAADAHAESTEELERP